MIQEMHQFVKYLLILFIRRNIPPWRSYCSENQSSSMKPGGTTCTAVTIYPPIADGEGIAMDALALGIAEARRKLLDGRYLLTLKPDFVVGRHAVGHGTAEYFIDSVSAQVAVARGVLSGKTAIHIEVWAADQRDQVTIR